MRNSREIAYSFGLYCDFANGNTRNRHGARYRLRIRTAGHVYRVRGSITMLMNSYEGKRLNSPHDIVVKSDGPIWFSDPSTGIVGYFEGNTSGADL